MAYSLIWAPTARDDLKSIVKFIARDNPERAASFGYQLIDQADKLQEFPEIGRVVPEKRDPSVREIVFRPYRLIYRISHADHVIQIVRVWHAARGKPEGI
jgi:toxin ParE1/3/4